MLLRIEMYCQDYGHELPNWSAIVEIEDMFVGFVYLDLVQKKKFQPTINWSIG